MTKVAQLSEVLTFILNISTESAKSGYVIDNKFNVTANWNALMVNASDINLHGSASAREALERLYGGINTNQLFKKKYQQNALMLIEAVVRISFEHEPGKRQLISNDIETHLSNFIRSINGVTSIVKKSNAKMEQVKLLKELRKSPDVKALKEDDLATIDTLSDTSVSSLSDDALELNTELKLSHVIPTSEDDQVTVQVEISNTRPTFVPPPKSPPPGTNNTHVRANNPLKQKGILDAIKLKTPSEEDQVTVQKETDVEISNTRPTFIPPPPKSPPPGTNNTHVRADNPLKQKGILDAIKLKTSSEENQVTVQKETDVEIANTRPTFIPPPPPPRNNNTYVRANNPLKQKGILDAIKVKAASEEEQVTVQKDTDAVINNTRPAFIPPPPKSPPPGTNNTHVRANNPLKQKGILDAIKVKAASEEEQVAVQKDTDVVITNTRPNFIPPPPPREMIFVDVELADIDLVRVGMKAPQDPKKLSMSDNVSAFFVSTYEAIKNGAVRIYDFVAGIISAVWHYIVGTGSPHADYSQLPLRENVLEVVERSSEKAPVLEVITSKVTADEEQLVSSSIIDVADVNAKPAFIPPPPPRNDKVHVRADNPLMQKGILDAITSKATVKEGQQRPQQNINAANAGAGPAFIPPPPPRKPLADIEEENKALTGKSEARNLLVTHGVVTALQDFGAAKAKLKPVNMTRAKSSLNSSTNDSSPIAKIFARRKRIDGSDSGSDSDSDISSVFSDPVENSKTDKKKTAMTNPNSFESGITPSLTRSFAWPKPDNGQLVGVKTSAVSSGVFNSDSLAEKRNGLRKVDVPGVKQTISSQQPAPLGNFFNVDSGMLRKAQELPQYSLLSDGSDDGFNDECDTSTNLGSR